MIEMSKLTLPEKNGAAVEYEIVDAVARSVLDALYPKKSIGPSSAVAVTDARQGNATNVTIGIEPGQDLHGYDHPWPAGGGKNLIDDSKRYINASTTVYIGADSSDCTVALPAGVYTISVDFSGETYGMYYREANDTANRTIWNSGPSSVTEKTFTIEGDGVFRFWVYRDSDSGGVDPTKIIHAQIEKGSTATAYSPYSNVCPITGWTGAKVTRTGKNFLNPAKYDLQTRTFNGITYTVLSDGSVRAVGTSTAAGGPGLTSRFQLPAGTYYGNPSTGTGLSVVYRYATQETGGTTYATSNPFISDGTQWFYLNLYCNAANLTVDTVLYPQIELGTTFTGYEPYQGDIYNITFPSEAGTVYGGTLDVVNGVLTVDRAQITSYAGETLPGTWISDRDVYAAGATPTTGAQVVYELATPITYQLTPQQVALLLGNNTIFADTGDTALTYQRDVALLLGQL